MDSEKLLRPKDVASRYGVSQQTARRYIKECNPHMEKPLAVTAKAFYEWERKRTVTMPESMTKEDYERMLASIRCGAKLIVPSKG